jgi:alpha-tubulin suppressor-like RCC1 family protein
VTSLSGNAYGQLGDNTQLNKLVPGFVQGVTDAVAITCGFCHSCLLRSNGQAMCWGCNTQGYVFFVMFYLAV